MTLLYFGPGRAGVSSGWGEGSRNELHFMFLSAISNSECRSRLPEYSSVIYEHSLCMMSRFLGYGLCDRGNPLDERGELIGISSWDASFDGTLPSVHERISHFLPWIQSIIL